MVDTKENILTKLINNSKNKVSIARVGTFMALSLLFGCNNDSTEIKSEEEDTTIEVIDMVKNSKEFFAMKKAYKFDPKINDTVVDMSNFNLEIKKFLPNLKDTTEITGNEVKKMIDDLDVGQIDLSNEKKLKEELNFLLDCGAYYYDSGNYNTCKSFENLYLRILTKWKLGYEVNSQNLAGINELLRDIKKLAIKNGRNDISEEIDAFKKGKTWAYEVSENSDENINEALAYISHHALSDKNPDVNILGYVFVDANLENDLMTAELCAELNRFLSAALNNVNGEDIINNDLGQLNAAMFYRLKFSESNNKNDFNLEPSTFFDNSNKNFNKLLIYKWQNLGENYFYAGKLDSAKIYYEKNYKIKKSDLFNTITKMPKGADSKILLHNLGIKENVSDEKIIYDKNSLDELSKLFKLNNDANNNFQSILISRLNINKTNLEEILEKYPKINEEDFDNILKNKEKISEEDKKLQVIEKELEDMKEIYKYLNMPTYEISYYLSRIYYFLDKDKDMAMDELKEAFDGNNKYNTSITKLILGSMISKFGMKIGGDSKTYYGLYWQTKLLQIDLEINNILRDIIINKGKFEEVLAALKKASDAVDARDTYRNFAILIGLLGILMMLSLIYGYRNNRKFKESNKQLAQKTEELEVSNKELEVTNEIITGLFKTLQEKNQDIEKKNQDISDSINYAKKIQDALLGMPKDFEQNLQNVGCESFVLFDPRDVISGDMYWFSGVENDFYFALPDCTGHSVPGALLTMLGHTILSEIYANFQRISVSDQEEQKQPQNMLNKTNKEINSKLRQTGEIGSNKDGMDMALFRVIKRDGKQILQFSGAKSISYIIRDGKIIQLSGDKISIGGGGSISGFVKQEFELKQGDVIYAFSDGYADQFGGPYGKKFMYGKFRELLISIADKPMNVQKGILEEEFNKWKGKNEQVDDVTVIGVRIP